MSSPDQTRNKKPTLVTAGVAAVVLVGVFVYVGWFNSEQSYQDAPKNTEIEQAFTDHFNELMTYSPLSFEGLGPVSVVDVAIVSVSERTGLQWDVVADLTLKPEGSDTVLPPARVAMRVGRTRDGYALLEYQLTEESANTLKQ